MLPEWAGRKAAATPSPPAQPDETAPLPAVGPVEAIAEPAPEVETFGSANIDVEPAADEAVVHLDEAASGDFAQPAEAVDSSQDGRSFAALVVLALVALAAGIGAGYLYLMFAG